MTTFINCTPHDISVRGAGVIPASGTVPRCATQRKEAQPLGGVRLVIQTMGDVTGLPASAPDTIFIVSGMVLQALQGSRPDVVAPDTGADAVRVQGQIVEVLGFVQ